jgi:hypothetical protein
MSNKDRYNDPEYYDHDRSFGWNMLVGIMYGAAEGIVCALFNIFD